MCTKFSVPIFITIEISLESSTSPEFQIVVTKLLLIHLTLTNNSVGKTHVLSAQRHLC